MTQLENLQPFTEQIETIQTTITNFYQTLKNNTFHQMKDESDKHAFKRGKGIVEQFQESLLNLNKMIEQEQKMNQFFETCKENKQRIMTHTNELINEFNKIGINTILYANGARIETYLKSANCKFWPAMYPEDDKIPNKDYKAFVLDELEKIKTSQKSLDDSFLNSDVNKADTETVTYSSEYLDKVIGWQFTESGAKKSGIDKYIDLSLFDNQYLMKYLKKD